MLVYQRVSERIMNNVANRQPENKLINLQFYQFWRFGSTKY